MAYAKNPFLQAARATSSTKPSSGFWSSPAGKHVRLARSCFALAKKHQTAGDKKKYWNLLKTGRGALALARQEIYLWKRGQSIRRKSHAIQRAA
jgi:hypothetical protein